MRKYFLLLGSVLLVGCSTVAHLYPVDGPLHEQAPTTVLKAKVKGIMRNSGSISLQMPNGEMCEGRWAVIAPQSMGYTQGSGMLTGGGAVITGNATSISTGFEGRVNNGQAYLSCNEGTVLQVEFQVGSGTASGFGGAKDNKGNIYKVVF